MWIWIATLRCYAGYELRRAHDLVEEIHDRLDLKSKVMTSFGTLAMRKFL